MKIVIKCEDIKSHNPVAQTLRFGQFRRQTVRNKKRYTRKGRGKGNRHTDSPFNSVYRSANGGGS